MVQNNVCACFISVFPSVRLIKQNRLWEGWETERKSCQGWCWQRAKQFCRERERVCVHVCVMQRQAEWKLVALKRLRTNVCFQSCIYQKCLIWILRRSNNKTALTVCFSKKTPNRNRQYKKQECSVKWQSKNMWVCVFVFRHARLWTHAHISLSHTHSSTHMHYANDRVDKSSPCSPPWSSRKCLIKKQPNKRPPSQTLLNVTFRWRSKNIA